MSIFIENDARLATNSSIGESGAMRQCETKRTSTCSRKTRNGKKHLFGQPLQVTIEKLALKIGDTAFLNFEIIIVIVFSHF